jgi:broad specificity phosphatase PhoE
MTTLFLVRHGQASFGQRNYDVLSEIGERQGQILGRHWAQLQPNFDAVYSGAMVRQRRTGEEVLSAFPEPRLAITEHAGFDEYNADAVMRAYLPLIAREHPEFTLERRQLFSDRARFQQLFEMIIGAWVDRRPHAEKELQSWDDFCARCVAGLRDIAPRDAEQVLVFTSGGVITAALREALKLDDHTAFRCNWRIFNASVHRFHLGRRGLSLTEFNNVTHLELARDPALLTFR